MDAASNPPRTDARRGSSEGGIEGCICPRVEMLPLFLDEIETYLALEPVARAKPTPLFFIFHLLGEWREKAAYRPLARLLRLPGLRSIGSLATGSRQRATG